MGLFTEFSVVNSNHTNVSPVLMGLGESADKEEILARRFQRRNLFQQDLVFEFTRDRGLLQQYYQIRANQYNIHHSVTGFAADETEHDRKGHVMVVRMGNFCVGGARINVKSPRKNDLLPMEIKGFRLEEHFPQLAHKQIVYGQTGAIVLLPEFRGGDVTMEMFHRLHNKGLALNMDISFAVAPKLNARLERQNCVAIGMKAKIHYDIELPSYPPVEDVKPYLLSMILRKPLIKESVVSIQDEKKYEMV